jgi:putative FmdB family regulatory protein
MPIYQYLCENCGRFTEQILKISDAINEVPCDDCDGKLIKQWSTFNSLNITPETVYFKNPETGQVQLAGNKYDTGPNGYIKEEAKGLAGRLQLEKRLQNQDRDNAKAVHYNELMNKHILTKQRHDEIKANFNTVHTIKHEDGSEEKFTLDDQTKDLMKLAMDRSNKKEPKYKDRPFIFPVNHNDKSNRSKE